MLFLKPDYYKYRKYLENNFLQKFQEFSQNRLRLFALRYDRYGNITCLAYIKSILFEAYQIH